MQTSPPRLFRPDIALLSLGLALVSCSDSSDTSFGLLYDGYDQDQVSLPILTDLTLSPVAAVGGITSYAISPALPAGLSLNTTSGVISGTATALATQQTYTVRASNGSVVDDDTFTLEVRGPLLGLSTDMPLVRTSTSSDLPPTTVEGGVGLTDPAPTTTDATVTIVDDPQDASAALIAASGAPSQPTGVAPGSHDSLVDFVAAISVDDSELSADAWTLEVRPPYDGSSLAPDLAGFTFDSAAVPPVDGELALDVALASPALGPFTSAALSSSAYTHSQVTEFFESMATPGRFVGTDLYFVGAPSVENRFKLMRYRGGANPSVEQVVNLVNGSSDGVNILGLLGDQLVLSMVNAASNSKLFLYDTVQGELNQASDIDPLGSDFPGSTLVMEGVLYFTATLSGSSHLYRHIPAAGVNPAATERISFTTTLSNADEQPGGLLVHDGRLYYTANYGDGSTRHLFCFDPSNDTQTRLSANAQAPAGQILSAAGELFVVAQGPGGAPKLHRLNAAGDGLEQIADLSGDGAVDDDIQLLGGNPSGMLFNANNANGDVKLHLYQPGVTAATLEQIVDLRGAGQNDSIGSAADGGERLYFTGQNALGNTKLYAYDYGSGITTQLVELNGEASSDSPGDLQMLPDGRLLLWMDSDDTGGFSGYIYDPSVGRVLLVSDPAGPSVDDDNFIMAQTPEGNVLFINDDATGNVAMYLLE